jgi:hypothetical protein
MLLPLIKKVYAYIWIFFPFICLVFSPVVLFMWSRTWHCLELNSQLWNKINQKEHENVLAIRSEVCIKFKCELFLSGEIMSTILYGTRVYLEMLGKNLYACACAPVRRDKQWIVTSQFIFVFYQRLLKCHHPSSVNCISLQYSHTVLGLLVIER